MDNLVSASAPDAECASIARSSLAVNRVSQGKNRGWMFFLRRHVGCARDSEINFCTDILALRRSHAVTGGGFFSVSLIQQFQNHAMEVFSVVGRVEIFLHQRLEGQIKREEENHIEARRRHRAW